MTERRPDRSRYDSKNRRRPAWPDRLVELGGLLHSAGDESESARSRVWLLLNSVLQQRIRAESRRTGPIGPEDLEDLAAEKALDLMNKLDAKEWDLAGSTRENVIGFVSTVARNGLIDVLRRKSRRPAQSDADVEALGGGRARGGMPPTAPPDPVARRSEFVEAIVHCAGELNPDHRKVWLFRVFLDMPSKHIANHPALDLRSSHVDVILQRRRKRVRDCMRAAGFEAADLPPGTFTAMWRAFGMDEQSL